MKKIEIKRLAHLTYLKIDELYYSNLKFDGKDFIVFEGKKYFLTKYEELEKIGFINKIRSPRKRKTKNKTSKTS